jgi:DNA integrity scanning protein DisA with diadenylate cyclase activity
VSVPELELAQITERLDAIVLRRDRNRVVRIFVKNGSLQHAGRRWTVAPSVFAAIEQTRRVAPMVGWKALQELLEFACYVLSPWHIGSTLVWLLSANDRLPDGIDLQPLALSLGPALPGLAFAAHLLAQYDGATIIWQDGRLLRTGVHLNATQKTHDIVQPLSGLRHTSAKRASFDHANTLIVTVSSDGPVTIFSDGMSVFELGWYSAESDARITGTVAGSSYSDLVMSSGTVRTCPNCGKTSAVEILTVAGYREHEEACCPVCGHVIASDMCFRIHANLKKVY